MRDYLLVDTLCDYKETKNYKELKERLIELVINDTMECGINNKDILENNIAILSRLAREDFTSLDYIINELESFSYKTIDLIKVQRDLEDIKDYLLGNEKYVGNICETIDLVKELRK